MKKVKQNKLTTEELNKLYNAYCYSYRDKYCKTSFGSAGLIGIEEYYEIFGLEDFILTNNTKKYIREEINETDN